MDAVTVPFNSENEIWGCSVYIPYIPHKDPKNPAYIPIPDPANDPYWMAPELPPFEMVKTTATSAKATCGDDLQEPNAIITEATVPSASSELEGGSTINQAMEICALKSKLDSFASIMKDTQAALLMLENEASPLASPQCCPVQVIDTFADAGSNTAVRSPSPIPSIRTPDRDSMSQSSLPSGSIITVIEDWRGTEAYVVAEPIPVRPATAFENRKLDNVMFDCDGHIGCTNNLTGLSKTPSFVRSRPAVQLTHVDDFESASQMPQPNNGPMMTSSCQQASQRASQTHHHTAVTRLSSSEELLLSFLAAAQNEPISAEAAAEEAAFSRLVSSVTEVYTQWGLNSEDAYVDVITGFHRVGSATKRMCLGIHKRQSPFLISLENWTADHTKLSIYVEHYCAFCETLRDDQVMRVFRDLLWAVFNNGRVLDVVVLDSTVRELPVGQYQNKSVEPLKMLESLVSAWGGQYKYSKIPTSA